MSEIESIIPADLWTEVEQPMALMRWKQGVLQQLWRVNAFLNGMPSGAHDEWRNVPEADE